MVAPEAPSGRRDSIAAIERREPFSIAGRGYRHEDQPELADLEFVAAVQHRLLGSLPVQIRAVQRIKVAQGERAPRRGDLGLAAGNGHVVKKDVVVGMTTQGGHPDREEIPRAGVRASHHSQDPGAGWDVTDRNADLVLPGFPDRSDRGEPDGRCRRVTSCGSFQYRSARGAEVGTLGVVMAAAIAEDGWCQLGSRSASGDPQRRPGTRQSQ